MKAVLEEILGRRTYSKLKENGSLKDWKYEIARLIDSIELSIKSTIRVADSDWYNDIDMLLQHGRESIKSSQTISDLFASLASTLTRLCFLQIGFVPRRMDIDRIPQSSRYWTLDIHRSVQYVQTQGQKEALCMFKKQRK